MVNENFKKWAIGLVTLAVIVACGEAAEDDETGAGGSVTVASDYIYISSGSVFGGLTITPATPSNTVVRYTTDGVFDRTVIDYNTFNLGDSPVSLVDFDADHILVLVENPSGRRIDKVRKDGSTDPSTYITNATALSTTLRQMVATSDGGLLVARTTAIEKFNSSKARVLSGANPYVNAPAGGCATSTTAVYGVAVGPSDTIIMVHGAVSANNQVNLISANGYNAAADCLTGRDGATAAHIPTRALYHTTSGRLLVGFSNAGGPTHQVYAFTISATTILPGVQSYNNTSVLQGISGMAEMADGSVLIGSSQSTFNSVEKFTFDATTNTLTRVGTTSFIPSSIFTKSISDILVTD